MKEKKVAKHIKTMKVKGVRRGSPPLGNEARLAKEGLDFVKRNVRHLPAHHRAEANRSRGLVGGKKTSTKLKSGKRKK